MHCNNQKCTVVVKKRKQCTNRGRKIEEAGQDNPFFALYKNIKSWHRPQTPLPTHALWSMFVLPIFRLF